MLTRVLPVAICSVLLSTAYATPNNFNALYDYYFPKRGETVASSVYRRSFDANTLGRAPGKFSSARQRQLYYALRNDPSAFHAFMHNPDQNVDGAQGEEWDYECLLLLLRLGDSRFSQLLSREDSRTREGVGRAIEVMVDWSKHQFPKTRGVYTYRHTGPWHRI